MKPRTVFENTLLFAKSCLLQLHAVCFFVFFFFLFFFSFFFLVFFSSLSGVRKAADSALNIN